MDVNPLTMGVEVVDGMMSNVIPRNSEIPITKTKRFTTSTDYQRAVTIQVYEGERPKTKDNHFLGQFDLTDISLALRGIPEIDVTFDIDVNGILTVGVSHGKNQKLSVVFSLGYRTREKSACQAKY
jgi:heat shock protein 5